MDLGWWLVPAVLVLVLGVGRMARLITHDVFPPAVWLRQTWTNAMKEHSDWVILAFCHWCAGFWITVVAFFWFLLSLSVEWVAVAWWLFWTPFALSYVSSIIVSRDEPAE